MCRVAKQFIDVLLFHSFRFTQLCNGICIWICITRRRGFSASRTASNFYLSVADCFALSRFRLNVTIRQQEIKHKSDEKEDFQNIFYGHSFAKARQELFILYPLGTKMSEQNITGFSKISPENGSVYLYTKDSAHSEWNKRYLGILIAIFYSIYSIY